jgi:hypothetical protein
MIMKIKSMICVGALFSCMAMPSFAWDNPYNDSGDGSTDSNDPEYKYESNTGTRYKYDLSNPADRVMYDVDPAAQIMDEVNPMVDIDRETGQYGGGSDW